MAGDCNGFSSNVATEIGLRDVFTEDAMEDEVFGCVLGVVVDGDGGSVLSDGDV